METFIHAYSWVDLRFLLQGLWVTIYVSLISIALSFVVGLILGLIRYNSQLRKSEVTKEDNKQKWQVTDNIDNKAHDC